MSTEPISRRAPPVRTLTGARRFGRDQAIACVAASALHIPGRDAESVPAERAHELLGRKGLLYKEPATRLALCAVHRALGRPPRAPRETGPPDPATAVVVSSNLGNVETVTKVARLVREGSVRDVSPLDAPNASSNVIASTIAIWFRFGGPNLMVCSGATSGLDAVRLAGVLLAGRRATRVVVVGVEPEDAVASALEAGRRSAPRGRPLRAAAAALVLEAPGDANRGLPALSRVRVGARPGQLPRASGVVYGPRGSSAGTIDLEAELGGLYGALGVIQVAAATRLLSEPDARHTAATVVCGDPHDGWRSLGLLGGER